MPGQHVWASLCPWWIREKPDSDFIVEKTTEETGERGLRQFIRATLDDVGTWANAT